MYSCRSGVETIQAQEATLQTGKYEPSLAAIAVPPKMAESNADVDSE